MDAFSSEFSGLDYETVHGGFVTHRRYNLTVKTSEPFPKGFETRYLDSRAKFALVKAAELSKGGNKFVDRKVWSA